MLFKIQWLLPFMIAFPLLGQAPRSVDGATSPDQIPDVAFRLFFGATAENTTPTGTTGQTPSASLRPSARQAAKLLPAQLTSADITVFIEAVQTWQNKVFGTTSVASGRTTTADLDGTTQDVLTAMQAHMSPQGFASLLAYVRSQKRYMKRTYVPDMSQHAH